MRKHNADIELHYITLPHITLRYCIPNTKRCLKIHIFLISLHTLHEVTWQYTTSHCLKQLSGSHNICTTYLHYIHYIRCIHCITLRNITLHLHYVTLKNAFSSLLSYVHTYIKTLHMLPTLHTWRALHTLPTLDAQHTHIAIQHGTTQHSTTQHNTKHTSRTWHTWHTLHAQHTWHTLDTFHTYAHAIHPIQHIHTLEYIRVIRYIHYYVTWYYKEVMFHDRIFHYITWHCFTLPYMTWC